MTQEWVSSQAIAGLFGVSSRWVQQLTKDGIIHAVKDGKANRYDLWETARTYIQYLSEKANGKERSEQDMDAESRKLEAEADFKRSRADMAALQLKELERNLHRSEDVEAVMEDLAANIRAMLVALPGRLAMDVCQVNTASEASELIRREVYQVLEELSHYRYDPQEYARRVREREGWKDPDEEYDE